VPCADRITANYDNPPGLVFGTRIATTLHEAIIGLRFVQQMRGAVSTPAAGTTVNPISG